MATAVGSILRAATRRPGDKLNVLTACTHESWETCLARTGHQFWAVRTPKVKDWNPSYRPLPPNYILLNPHKGSEQIPVEVDFDVVLSQNKFGQYQLLAPIARRLHLPLISLEHTLPVPSWGKRRREMLRGMKGDIDVFISDFSRREWGFDESARVVHHGIDHELFSPDETVEKKRHGLSVVNDWINRDWCTGYRFWKQATEGLPTFVVGATPGLSKPAKDTAELVHRYREAQVFVNTSLVSPIPTALLEAMSCGVACVAIPNCMVGEIIQHRENGILCESPRSMRVEIKRLLDDPAECKRLGENARKTILERFSLDRFVAEWNGLLREAANITYLGAR